MFSNRFTLLMGPIVLMRRRILRLRWLGHSKAVIAVAFSVLLGCQNKAREELAIKKNPRPVQVETLALGLPPTAALVSASAGSWKTEQIGFEVGGRVEWVLEPNADIEGRIVVNGEPGQESERKVLIEGTPIARLESERYRLQVESAKAEVARAQQSVAAVEIEIEKSLPSQMRAAIAERTLAKTELDRSRRLVAQNAGAQADVDRDEANYQTALSRIEQLEANTKAKQAELQSLRLQVQKAEQALRDAERSLEDCTLYSSFRGQIASVDVVPGSVVSAGQPVATVQMMDPIKIELEVSAEDSRKMRKRQRIPLLVTQPDGSLKTYDGFLYLIDPVADPQTRTYTLTLLMLNERMVASDAAQGPEYPVTDQMWRLDFGFLPGAQDGVLYASEDSIRTDAEGPFLWKVLDFTHEDLLPPDQLIHVAKMRIELGPSRIPFLGNWVFQQVILQDDSFDAKQHLVAGKLMVQDGLPDEWVGDTLLIDRDNQWLVRPGDLVKVDLSNGAADPGVYVPMDAISSENGKTFIFVVEDSGTEEVARKQEVNLVTSSDNITSSLRRIEAVTKSESLVGKRMITLGVHYLRDGEPVKATSREVAQ